MNEPVKPGISMMAGFGFGWLTLVAAPVLSWFVLIMADGVLQNSNAFGSLLALLLATFPLLAITALAIGFLLKGHPRAALGVAAAAGSALALVILLVAACFGLVGINH
ncbi:MAG: hypothetical protein ABI866_03295 [Dokdonella sp.]